MTHQRTISNWLFLCAFMVFAMAVIGAVTRLTESGLSITEWKPISGALPPLGQAAWQHQFDLYKQSPEFAAKHFWMDLEDFKKIFFWEWLHRLWGRSIGLVYALPLLWFWVRKQIPSGYGWKLVALLALGGLQGFVGWFMVKSGLVDRPSVSHFRLAVHLSLALFLYAAMVWVGLDLRRSPPDRDESRMDLSRLVLAGWGLLTLLSVTIVWGAFVAGLKAGLIYNTFPLMGDGLIPPDFGSAFTAAPGVQFTHRVLAMATLTGTLAYASATRRVNRFAPYLAAMVVVQVGLGIATLLSVVNIGLATLHQAGAITLLTLALVSQHQLLNLKKI
ncbi:MAG: Heme synthase, cytochrome oxidase biosis protein Cox15-CtaA [Micavibrio sp.]|nr:Heme synthase, cytochrome oxidase biosis protein Cox15-CtaA [Micavibrio sp.]